MSKQDLEKADKPEIKLSTVGIIEKEREFQKKIYHCIIDYTKAFGCVGHNKFWETLQEMEIPILPREGILGRKIGKTILPISWETYVWVKK